MPASDNLTIVKSADTMGEAIWVANGDQDYERSYEAMNSPSLHLSKTTTRKYSNDDLQIATYSKSDFHERYMSSEEEPSPSPDSETGSQYDDDMGDAGDKSEESRCTNVMIEAGELTEVHVEECRPEIAVAVPIMAIGRPKLVDIAALAPMHKRKRSAEKLTFSHIDLGNAASVASSQSVESSSLTASQPSTGQTTKEHLSQHKSSTSVLAPESWLPEDDATSAEDDQYYFMDLGLRSPPSYNDYDPYSLNPPRLSPRNSYHVPARKPGSVTRARKQASLPRRTGSPVGWKGLGRPLSFVKRHEAYQPPRQVTKKPKMLARGASERGEAPFIPPFPFGSDRVKA